MLFADLKYTWVTVVASVKALTHKKGTIDWIGWDVGEGVFGVERLLHI